ncbi:hypothetical protein M876_00425 [Elizabethkingia anophelis FMS-007]|nr:hypothetical protein M876_00425 [Elizabethkingia anophelis FMS-007]EQB91377.1 hypothetical protein C874_12360 [Elizabethkingia anophelis 502]
MAKKAAAPKTIFFDNPNLSFIIILFLLIILLKNINTITIPYIAEVMLKKY